MHHSRPEKGRVNHKLKKHGSAGLKTDNVAIIGFSDFGLGRGLYIAEALSSLGLRITVITNKPIYNPKQQTFGNLLWRPHTRVVEFRIPFAEILYNSIFGRLIVYLLFGALSFRELLRLNPRPTVIYSRSPNGPFSDISTLLYKRLNRKVLTICGITDLLPDCLEYLDMNHVLKRMMLAFGHSINHLVYPRVDRIVTLNDDMAWILQERFGRGVSVIYGSIDLDVFRPMTKKEAFTALPPEFNLSLNGKFVVLYAGVMSPFQNPLVIIDIADQLQQDRKEVVFVAIGSGPLKEELKRQVHERCLQNVIVLDVFSHELMPFIYNISDLTIFPPPVLSNPRMYQFFKIALPKKFIEYTACGKPILCLTPSCVASSLCLEWEAGFHVLPEDISEAADMIKTLAKDAELKKQIGRNARLLAQKLFSTESAAITLQKALYC